MVANNKTITTIQIGETVALTKTTLVASPTKGAYDVTGALRVTLNDTAGKGAYAGDGSLRITNVAGTGIMDNTGALRIGAAGALLGVMSPNPSINDSPATIDGLKGVMAPNGALRMKGATT